MQRLIRFFSATAMILACGASATYADYPDPLRCLIEASDIVELSSPVEGIISAVEVERGDHVKAGQTIAQLDTLIETIGLKLAEARANNTAAILAREVRLKFLVLQAERSTKLAKRKTVSEAIRDEALQEAEVARQELKAARLDLEIAKLEAKRAAAILEQKVLRTPISGIVVERLLSAGEYQAGDTKIATIAKVDILHVEAIAPIEYYDRLSVEDFVTIRPEQPIGGTYRAQITVIDQVLDAATGTFGFRMKLPNENNHLPAGLRCMVEFTSPSVK